MHKKLSLDEYWNAWTHFIGVLFGLIGFPFLIAQVYELNSTKDFVATIIYTFSFLLLFSASTTYHLVTSEKKKRLWRKIDHISIYFMIAGSYTPYMIRYIEYDRSIMFMTIMYSLILIGTILKISFTGKFEKASLILYVFLGWMVVFIGKSFYVAASVGVLSMVVSGGIAYMCGIYFYINDSKKYYHAIWHVFVLIGGILHFLGVYLM